MMLNKGGILADEMGLGKTVEVLALIVSHSPASTPTLASTKENVFPLALDRNDREIESDVAATVEFLKSSIAAACEVEYMFPPRKRLSGSRRLAHLRDHVSCEACGVQYRMSEVHWSPRLDSHTKRFICPFCIEDNDITFDISTTLIVVPESLLHQWYEEIRRHCRESVRIEVYYGVAYDGYKHPFYLGSCDIILCAYETLQKEIHHVLNSSRKELRKRPHPTRRGYPSPLLALNFWRICLDECQLVKNKVHAASKLCSMLRARYRWCVTGTPLSSSANDLYGLLHFIGLFPYCIDAVWDHYVFYPYLKSMFGTMVSVISPLFWRNSKRDVASQLENIVRKDLLVELSFTPIEERLYTAKIVKSKVKMNALVSPLLQHNDVNTPLSSLPSEKIDQIFSIINDVRLSILAGESYRQRKFPNSLPGFQTFSQELILRKLLEDATTLVCQCYRDVIANRNALAALHFLIGDDLGALNWYKQSYNVRIEQVEMNRMFGLEDEHVGMSAQSLGQENDKERASEIQKEPISCPDSSRPSKSLRIDSLQIIHIGRNVEFLASSLREAKEFIAYSGIVDLALRSHQHYVRAEVVAVSRVKKKWCEADSHWLDANKEFDETRASYDTMLDGFSNANLLDRSSITMGLSDRLRIFDKDTHALREFYANFRKVVVSMLLPFVPKQEGADSQITGEVLTLPRSELAEFTQMVTCKHNEPVDNELSGVLTHDSNGKSHSSNFFPLPSVDSCVLCEVNAFLFKHDSGTAIKGNFCFEKLSAENFFAMLTLGSRHLKTRMRSFSNMLINWFNAIDRLVLVGRELTVVIQEWINREREIIVGTTRLQLGMEAHFISMPFPLILGPSNLDMALDLFRESEKRSAEAVTKSLSSLRYLNTLRKQSKNCPNEVRECPCCYAEMKYMWAVFPCAHTVCTSCMGKLKSKSLIGPLIRCITCRQLCSVDATMYVVDEKHEPIYDMKITVKFDHIIRLLKKLIMEDCTNKIIVFTSISAAIPPFEELLKLLKLPALVLNGGSKSNMLNRFRNNPELKILLLPLRMGANGLNLTQANHVVFMEPITEISVFAQAVGRIDRIGQRRAITVHNFVVLGSIEEEIYRIVSKGTEQSKWTLQTLRQVFGFDTQ
ncbi:hypothetical protein KIN20_000999 [Parelaphostrongylus tenuis]|uniref:E3 ubiquitin-protein ligase SHPRH n=1 Tax=Parelaphostrongylus tenuis TaxID=148309 RepID=A0AAD5MEK0_PARTN|nr:hypothetical protein KIN20_000999 [Parelaphostrongylus tenuis]